MELTKNNDIKEIDFSRLDGSVDVSFLKNSHVLCIGVGGASGICEDLVRSGLGNLTVVDFDVVDKSNLATQGFYLSDIGKFKVVALEERLKNVNQDLNFKGINKNFLDITDDELDKTSKVDLLLMMTDSFEAQKRGNLVSLKYKIPAIFAIMYELARCAEITFNIPGVTPACHRCAVSSRYNEYESGYTNKITSKGSTIFQTHYLNSAIGMVALAILHRDKNNCEFGNWFGNNWERNLIQLRLNPNYLDGMSIFNRTFDCSSLSKTRTFSFDAIWQKIEHECPPKYKSCPDCGGTANLLDVKIEKTI
jgi:molybdopterin/thiamine biosynthesis adenylyltransferase